MSPAYSYPLAFPSRRSLTLGGFVSSLLSSIYSSSASQISSVTKAPVTHNLSKAYTARLFNNPSQISHYVKSSDVLFRLQPQIIKDIGALLLSNPDAPILN